MATTARKTSKRASNKQFDNDQLTTFYKDMLLIRRFEEKAGQLYGMGLIGGFCHLYIGQEAVVVGIQHELETGRDSVITGYRDHGHMLATGMDPDGVMAELTGREGGYSKGKGGSMHLIDIEHNVTAAVPIVGSSISIGVGVGFGLKMLSGSENIAVVYFGDGATEEGVFAESLRDTRRVTHGHANRNAMGSTCVARARSRAAGGRSAGLCECKMQRQNTCVQ